MVQLFYQVMVYGTMSSYSVDAARKWTDVDQQSRTLSIIPLVVTQALLRSLVPALNLRTKGEPGEFRSGLEKTRY